MQILVDIQLKLKVNRNYPIYPYSSHCWIHNWILNMLPSSHQVVHPIPKIEIHWILKHYKPKQ